MPGSPTPLGPFVDGLNTVSEEATISDTQLAALVNMEVDLDGSLVSRPAIVSAASTPVAGEPLDTLGWYVRSDNATFLVCTTNSKTWLYDVNAGTYTQIWTTKASGCTQYDNKVVLVSEAAAGGYWEAGTFTATATMPTGSDIVFYQERFWIFGQRNTANATRVWFSNITSAGAPPTSIWNWTTATDFFEVNKGDGEWITGLLPDVNSLIIFRNRSTWRLTYATSPFSGRLDQVNTVIGADNKKCFSQYESYYLVLSQGHLYQFTNYQFYPLDVKRVDLKGATTPSGLQHDVRVSVVGQRCLIWYYGALYAYNVVTNTWSTWESTHYVSHMLQVPPTSLLGDVRVAYGVSGISDATHRGLYRLRDEALLTGTGEAISCMIRTKAYSLEEAAQFKRMFYWTFEVRSSSGGKGIAYPSVIPTDAVTWNDMSLHTWNDLSQGTWNNPLIILPKYETNVAFPTQSPVRSLIKATQDSRFLRMYFEVYLETDGTAATAPARIYTITPYLRIKSGVSKQVS